MLAVAATLLGSTGGLLACPVCGGENGAEVRAALAGDDGVLTNVLAATLPSLAFAGVVAGVYFGWPAPRRRDGGGRQP